MRRFVLVALLPLFASMALTGCGNTSNTVKGSASTPLVQDSKSQTDFIPDGFQAVAIDKLETYIPEDWVQSDSDSSSLLYFLLPGKSDKEAALFAMQVKGDVKETNGITDSEYEQLIKSHIDEEGMNYTGVDESNDGVRYLSYFKANKVSGAITRGFAVIYKAKLYRFEYYHAPEVDVEDPMPFMGVYLHTID